MIWEVKKRFTHKGHKLKMWHNIDVAGRWIYVVALDEDPYSPIQGYHTQKEALKRCLEGIELSKIREENIKREMSTMGLRI